MGRGATLQRRGLVTAGLLVVAAAGLTGPAAVARAEHDTPAVCTFERGVTTCVTTTTATTTSTHVATSGCVYGPAGVPGSRQRTFLDTYLVTTVTVTRRHGHAGAAFDVAPPTTTSVLQSSQLISDVCLPI